MPTPQQLIATSEAYQKFDALIEEAKKSLSETTIKLEHDLATKKINELLAILKAA